MSLYKIEDKLLASVTTIISDCTDKSSALTQWSANMVVEWIKRNSVYVSGDYQDRTIGYYSVDSKSLNDASKHFREVSQEALDVGSAIHDAIHYWFKTGQEPMMPKDEVLAGFIAFLEWVDIHKVKPIATEQTVYNDMSAGTLDFVGWVDGHVTVIDFKSSKAIYPEHRIQTAAYRSMWNLRLDQEATRNAILRLDKTSGFPEYKDVSKFYKTDLNIYHKMVDLYYSRHPRIAKGAKIDILI